MSTYSFIYILLFSLFNFCWEDEKDSCYGPLPFKHNHNHSNIDNYIILREQSMLFIFQNAV